MGPMNDCGTRDHSNRTTAQQRANHRARSGKQAFQLDRRKTPDVLWLTEVCDKFFRRG